MSRRGERPRLRFRMFLKVAALTFLVTAGASMLLPPSWIGMGRIGPDALAGRVAAGDPNTVVVDVRTGSEYRGGHIQGAISVPLHTLPFRVGSLWDAKDKEVVLICLSGHRSRTAGLILESAGFSRVTNLDGGMAAWRARGLPEVPPRTGPGGSPV